jgi:hypothetical protein
MFNGSPCSFKSSWLNTENTFYLVEMMTKWGGLISSGAMSNKSHNFPNNLELIVNLFLLHTYLFGMVESVVTNGVNCALDNGKCVVKGI